MTSDDPARKPTVSRRRVAVLLACAAVAAVGAGILFAFDPARARFFPPCPLRTLTGLYCPGCGSTRALHHLTHGRLATALGYNPLVPLLLPYVAFAGGRQALRWASVLTPRPGPRIPASCIWALVVVILVFAVLRNVPATPFSRLAPGSGVALPTFRRRLASLDVEAGHTRPFPRARPRVFAFEEARA